MNVNSGEGRERAVELSLSKQPPKSIAPGDFFTLRARARCEGLSQLQGLVLRVLDRQGGLLRELRLTAALPGCCDTDMVCLRAPLEAGTYSYRLLFPAQRLGDIRLAESSLAFSFQVEGAHAVRMQLWGLPGAVAPGQRLSFRAGLKCSACCALSGQALRVVDGEGRLVAAFALGREPWGPSGAMYWADMAFPAPLEEGSYSYRVLFDGDGREHAPCQASLGFRVEAAGAIGVNIQVLSGEGMEPVAGAALFVRPHHRALTDAAGLAQLRLPKGRHRLVVSGGDAYNMHGEDILADEAAAGPLRVLLQPLDRAADFCG